MAEESLTPSFEAVMQEMQPNNRVWLETLAKTVAESAALPVSERIEMGGNQGATIKVVMLPGSFLDVRYLGDVAAAIGENYDSAIVGLNYPGRIHGDTDAARIDQLHLADYVNSVYRQLLQESKGVEELDLVGHSLGTIVLQLVSYLSYYYKEHGQPDMVLPLKKVAILGGGPPKLGLSDYFNTFTSKIGTLPIVLQMVNSPGHFISDKGMMWRTLGAEPDSTDKKSRYKGFVADGWIYQESNPIMHETFFGDDYTFLPGPPLEAMGVEALFAYDTQDLFVAESSSEKALRQWGAIARKSSAGHSGMVFGGVGAQLGVDIADFFNARRH
jgi:hypothetical protein